MNDDPELEKDALVSTHESDESIARKDGYELPLPLDEVSEAELTLDEIFLISPEEYFPDCGCGLVVSCVTLDAELHDCEDGVFFEEEINEDSYELAEDEDKDDTSVAQPADINAADSSSVDSGEHRESQEDGDTADEAHKNKASDLTCFVATAAFRDCDHPHVTFLREYRDNTLSGNCFGKAFIAVYWRVGPVLAVPVSRYDRLAKFSRIILSGIVFLLRR